MSIHSLKRQIKRLEEQQYELEKEHRGKEQEYTYHSGFELGYLKGKINKMQDHLDDLISSEIEIENLKHKYHELLFQVENKYPNETRHETALRCIRDYKKPLNIIEQHENPI